jgi:hypothetical protein
MRHAYLTANLAAAFLLGALSSVASAEEPATIPFATGGVGLNAQEELIARQGEFLLKLVFAEKGTGSYLANVGVTIADHSGQTVLDATSDGPWFYAKLPAGVYRVTAAFDGVAQTVQVGIPAAGLKVEYLRWDPPTGATAGGQG